MKTRIIRIRKSKKYPPLYEIMEGNKSHGSIRGKAEAKKMADQYRWLRDKKKKKRK